MLEKQVDADEYISAAGISGIVEEIGLRTTRVRSFDGTLNFIPNRNIATVSNHSRGNMRALVDIGISYDENIDQAMAFYATALGCGVGRSNPGAIIFEFYGHQLVAHMTKEDLIPECEGIVGGAHLIEEVMEGDCRVLSY